VSAQQRPKPPKWDGKGLPPVGMDVIFETASSGFVIGTVTGYHVMGHLGGDPAYHRVCVDMVYKDTTIPNSRLLKDVKPVPDAPLKQVDKLFVCDFCNKTQDEAFHMIVGQRETAICDACVDVCNEALAEKRKEQPA
jgi:hypothetical protein